MPTKRRKPLRPLVVQLKQEALRRGFSTGELAKAAGIGPTTVHYLLTGVGSPTLATLEAVGEVLGIEILGKPKR